MLAFVAGRVKPHLPADRAARLELAVEEWSANLCHHAYPEAGGTFRVSVAGGQGRIVVEVRDHGRPFDPTALPAPDVGAPLAEREPGGLGVLLIHRMVDDVRYRRERGYNVVTFTVVTAAPPS